MRMFNNGIVRLTILLMIKMLHDLNDPKLWELWYTSYHG